MANTPNDHDPKPVPPDDPSAAPPNPDELNELNELDDLADLADLPDDPLLQDPEPAVEAVPLDELVPDAEPASLSGLGTPALPDLADVPGDEVAEALPASGSDLLSSAEPPNPVAPASGWLDDPSPDAAHAPPLEVNPADLFEDPSGPLPAQPVDSSDIFGGGVPPMADRAESSDVIAATAYGEAEEAKPRSGAAPSDVNLTPEPPPGGSTVETAAGENLPVAEELPEAEEVGSVDLFGSGAGESVFDSAQLAHAPDLPGASGEDDAPDFGVTPDLTPDASSILADLSDPDVGAGDESSSVRLDVPGVSRTTADDLHDGTEFDLTVSSGAIPKELEEAEAAAKEGSTEWGEAAGLFDDARTEPDVALPAGEGSSILGGGKQKPAEPAEVPLAETPLKGETGSDSSVEFSDHPVAEDESSLSRTFRGPPSPAPARPPAPSEPDLDLAGIGEPESIDWSVPPDPSSLGLEPPSGILPPGTWTIPDGGRAAKAEGDKPTPRRPLNAPSDPAASDPSVEIDWMSGSSDEQPVVFAEEPAAAEVPAAAEAAWEPDAPTREADKVADKGKGKTKEKPKAKEKEKAKTTPAKPPAAEDRTGEAEKTRPGRAKSGKGGWVGGTLLGMVVAGGACAGAYFSGLVPNAEKTAQAPNRPQPGANPNPTPGDGTPAAPTAADVDAALRAGDPDRAMKLAAEVKEPTPVLKASQGAAQLFAAVKDAKPDEAALKAARENLQALVDDAEAAKTPEGEKAAVLAAIRVGVTHELAGDLAAARKAYEAAKAKFPKYAGTIDASLERINAVSPPAPMPDGNSRRPDDPRDARRLIVLAVTLLQDDPPAKVEKADDAEAGVFFWKAVNKAAAGDYADAVNEIQKAKAAHVKQAKAMAGRGLNPLSDPLEQIFPKACDDLKSYWELRAAIYSNKAVADLFKKDGAEKALAALADAQKKAVEAVKLAAELKDADAKLTVAAKDLKDAKDLVTKLEKDVTAAGDAKLAAEKKLDAEEKARAAADSLVASLAKELQTAKLLPEKFDAAELLAAQKTAADRATGPNLTTLVSPGMMAVGGAGLSTGQLLDVAQRLAKAEAAARAADAKLAAETKRLAAEYADGTAKLKDVQALELKKLADKYTDDAKKLTDDFQGKIKDLETAVVKEKERGEAMAAQFKKDLGSAISPAQALDLWLPLLVELRRPADADPALATAEKVLAAAGPNTEDAAKARTVAGLASLYKNEFAAAKLQFQAAKASPAYEPAAKAKTLWALAADVGLASVADPLAPYRRAPELPKRDPIAAARYLDAGIKAYRAARYPDAVAALTESTKADPTAPLAWYFLGAARWESGSTDGARDDFRQGAVREVESNVPTRVISAALAPIQGPARDALDAARP